MKTKQNKKIPQTSQTPKVTHEGTDIKKELVSNKEIKLLLKISHVENSQPDSFTAKFKILLNIQGRKKSTASKKVAKASEEGTFTN